MTADVEQGGGRGGIPWRVIGWGGAAFLLLLPLITGAPWDAFDYFFMGALLGGVGLGLELASRMGAAYRMAVGAALVASLLLVWINGAVGIIGSEREDANLLFGGVLLMALAGAIVARFRAAGMARAMSAAAIVQAMVPVIALVSGLGSAGPVLQPEVLVLTGFFTGMWLLSVGLFRKAAA